MNTWRCLYDVHYGIRESASMTIDTKYLYLGGRIDERSIWNGFQYDHPYTVARLPIDGLVAEYIDQIKTTFRLKPSDDTRRLAATNGSSKAVEDDDNIMPWKVRWSWLPGFMGTNGPILKLLPANPPSPYISSPSQPTARPTPSPSTATGDNEDYCIYIGGAFNNFPALVHWCPSTITSTTPISTSHLRALSVTGGESPIGGIVTPVGGKNHSINGLVTSLLIVSIPSPVVTSAPDDNEDIIGKILHPDPSQRDYTFIILLACIGVGIMIGLCFTISCLSSSKVPYIYDNPYSYDNTDPRNGENQLVTTNPNGRGSYQNPLYSPGSTGS